MKRILFILLLLVTASIAIVAASETQQEYNVTDAFLSVKLPDDWVYADRNLDDDNGLALTMKMSAAEMKETFIDDHIYMVGVSFSGDIVAILSIEDDDMEDYSGLSNLVLSSMANIFGSDYTANGNRLIKSRVVGDDNKFLKILFTDEQSVMACYRTVLNGRRYELYLQGSDLINQEELELVSDSIIGSIVFLPESDYLEYEIADIGMYISIPQGYTIFTEEERKALDPIGQFLLYAVSPDGKMQVHVDLLGLDDGQDLSEYTLEELESMSASMAEVLSQQAGNSTKITGSAKIVNEVPYLVNHTIMSIGNAKGCEISYSTILNGYQFSICFDPVVDTSGRYSSEMDKSMDDILNSIRYIELADQVGRSRAHYKKIKLDDPAFEIQIPDNFYVFWKNMPPDDYSLFATGDSVEKWDAYFDSNPGTVLCANSADGKATLDLIYMDSEIKQNSFTDVSDDELRRYMSNWFYGSGYAMHMYNMKFKYLKTDQYMFGIMSGERVNKKSRTYELRAMTYEKGKRFLMIYSNQSPLSEEEYETFKTILKSFTAIGKEQEMIFESDWVDSSEATNYPVKTGSLSIYLPFDYFCVTEDTSASDICLVEKGSDVESLKDFMTSSGYRLFAFSDDGSESMTVTITESGYPFDFSSLGFDQMLDILRDNDSAFTQFDGVSVKKSMPYYPERLRFHTNVIGWTKHHLSLQLDETEKVIYFTAMKGIEYLIVFDKKNIMAEDIERYDSIIDSVVVE